MHSSGRPVPLDNQLAFLAGGGEMGERIRRFDWSRNPLGPPSEWPASLRTAVRIMLTSRQAMFVWWGDALINLYNDAYKTIVGGKHPAALGQPASVVWREIWDSVEPRARTAMERDEGTYDESLRLIMERHGYPEETYYTFSYSPIPSDEGGPGGIICANTDDTRHVIGERQLALLRELAAQGGRAETEAQACELSIRGLSQNRFDLPFALLYLARPDQRLVLSGAAGIAPTHPAAPAEIPASDSSIWPFARVLSEHRPHLITRLDPALGEFPCGEWPRPPHQAVIVPIRSTHGDTESGILIAGLNPYRQFDEHYRGFIELVAGQIAGNIASAASYEAERTRSRVLSELDHAKTVFFSNVSHEFRTPLTLMLGPLDDLLDDPDSSFLDGQRQTLSVMRRNGQRLLKLVNTLLDFSRIEAGRAQATFQPIELGKFTAELASSFRSAIEKAGMTLTIESPAMAEPVFVDRDMWEKIVLNLVSNAFKYTLHGEIRVGLQTEAGHAVLRVRDTGVGIPESEQPHVFDRFHRVENAGGRTEEGSGIGLALVKELVRLHGGDVSVASRPGEGSTFTVSIPLGRDHVTPERLGAARPSSSTAVSANAFVEEALRWLPDSFSAESPLAVPIEPIDPKSIPLAAGARILVADDNADMRDYITKLLSPRFDVVAVGNGKAALAEAEARRPDLILSDIMMPEMDGFELVWAIRERPALADTPVILLSARAGAEASVEGLGAGADDYLVKPFSARELVARVATHVTLARSRRQAAEREQMLRNEAETLNALARDLAAELDLESLLQRVTDAGRQLTNARFGAFFYNNVDESGESYMLYTLSGVARSAFEKFGMPRNTGVFGATFRGEGVVRVDDITQDSRYGKNHPHRGMPEGHLPVRSYLAIPVITRTGEVIGGLFFGHPEPGMFTERAERLGLGVAAQAAIAFDNARLYTEARQEIAERARIETDLRQSQERFARFMQRLPGLAWIKDSEGRYVFANESAQKAFGRSSGEILGRTDDDLFTPDTAAAYRSADRQAVAQDAGLQFVETLQHPDGTFHSSLVSKFPIPSIDGTSTLIGGIAIDITERKAAEEALLEADRRKDEFLATLAHELRNPLAPIRNGLQILRLAGENPETSRNAIGMMERQLLQMIRLIDDLLDLSRISRGSIELKLENTDLARVVLQAVETSRPLIEQSRHRLDLDIPANLVTVTADVTRLSQVFANLLNNAAKYTAPGGAIRLALRAEAGEAIVTVSDNGVGIPPAMLQEVFEMFAQVDRSLERTHGGLGIGLSIARRLVEMHHGSIRAHSQGAGKGSQFEVRLPAAKGATETPKPEEGGRESPTGVRRRILVADDNELAASSLGTLLELMGNEVRVAKDGAEAVETAQNFEPDVILMDIGMPKLNGYEACKAIREQPWSKDAIMVALTGWGQDEARRRSKEVGFTHHMVKPVSPDALEALLGPLRG